MNFHEAKSKVWTYKIIGVLIALPAITSTIISMLKMLYFRLEDGTAMGAAIARPFKQLVSLVYENTQALVLFWQHSPTPILNDLMSRQNAYFLAVYLLFFVGLAFYSSGGRLNRRLRKAAFDHLLTISPIIPCSNCCGCCWRGFPEFSGCLSRNWKSIL